MSDRPPIPREGSDACVALIEACLAAARRLQEAEKEGAMTEDTPPLKQPLATDIITQPLIPMSNEQASSDP